MIAVAVYAVIISGVLLGLFVGRAFGRWESSEYYEPIIEEQRQVIDSLLPTGVKVLP